MAWLSLILAGIFEMLGVVLMNKFNKDRNFFSLLLLVLGFIGSFFLLSFSMKSLPMGTAYAVWTGIGASGGAILGMIFYGEDKDWKRVTCIGIIIASTIGLKLAS